MFRKKRKEKRFIFWAIISKTFASWMNEWMSGMAVPKQQFSFKFLCPEIFSTQVQMTEVRKIETAKMGRRNIIKYTQKQSKYE